jgi:hypothetical protein
LLQVARAGDLQIAQKGLAPISLIVIHFNFI